MSTTAALDKKNLVRLAFQEIIEAKTFDLKAVEKYFAATYIQTVDGKTLSYEGFVSHLKKQKETVAAAKVNFIALISEDNIVFSNHEVTVQKKDGTNAKFKVIAQFVIENDHIVSCDELTKLIEGDKSDGDLGSRR